MLYWGVGYEYLKLDGGEIHIPNDPHLLDFFNAGWNRRMDLILIARFSAEGLAGIGLDREMAAVLAALDKLKFQSDTDAEASAVVNRQCDDRFPDL
jgi:hypothetical protein